MKDSRVINIPEELSEVNKKLGLPLAKRFIKTVSFRRYYGELKFKGNVDKVAKGNSIKFGCYTPRIKPYLSIV